MFRNSFPLYTFVITILFAIASAAPATPSPRAPHPTLHMDAGPLPTQDQSPHGSHGPAGSLELRGRALRGTMLTRPAVASNGMLYTGAGSHLVVADCSGPSPVELGATYGHDHNYATAISGDYAYVAAYHHGLEIYDISDPTQPQLVSSLQTSFFESNWNLTISGHYAYVADIQSGLKIIDISNPHAPALVSTFEITNTKGVAVEGNLAYVVVGSWIQETMALYILDISNPAQPEPLGWVEGFGEGRNVSVEGQHAYVASWTGGLYAIDIRNPAAPIIVSNIGGMEAFDVQVRDGIAYVADLNGRIVTVDERDPTQPRILGSTQVGSLSFGLTLHGDHAFVGDGRAGVIRVDISTPETPTVVDGIENGGWAIDLAVEEDLVFVANAYRGLDVVSAGDSPLHMSSFDPGNDCIAVAAESTLVCLLDRGGNLHLLDSTDPSALKPLAQIPGFSSGEDVQMAHGIAYVADEIAGLRLVDISDPHHPFERGSVPISRGQPWSLALVGDRAILSGMNLLAAVVDVSDPDHPQELGAVGFPGMGVEVRANGFLAYVGDWNQGLRIIDIRDPAAPVEVGNYRPPIAGVVGIALQHPTVWISNEYDGIIEVDVSSPSAPQAVATHDPWGDAVDLAVRGTNLHVANGGSGYALYSSAPVTVTGGPGPSAPARTALLPPAPNPFNPHTTITFDVNEAGPADLAVYNARGSLVRQLQTGRLSSGRHAFVWDGKNTSGLTQPSGLYVARLSLNDAIDERPLLLLK